MSLIRKFVAKGAKQELKDWAAGLGDKASDALDQAKKRGRELVKNGKQVVTGEEPEPETILLNSEGEELRVIKDPHSNARELGSASGTGALTDEDCAELTAVLDKVFNWVGQSGAKVVERSDELVELRSVFGDKISVAMPSIESDGSYVLSMTREPTKAARLVGAKPMRVDYVEQPFPSYDNGDVAYSIVASVGGKEHILQMGSYYENQVYQPPLVQVRSIFDMLNAVAAIDDVKKSLPRD